VLDAGHGLGAVVGDVALCRRLLRLGAAATRAGYREGVGFVYNGAGVSVGFDFGLSVGAFTFVHTRDFFDSHPRQRRIESREVTQIFNRTTVINNFDVDRGNRNFINHGIDPGRITAVTRTEIHPVVIRDATGPGAHGERFGRDNRTLIVNRPHFSDNPQPPNRGGSPRASSPSPAVGSPYQPPRNGNQNDNNLQPRRNQPAPVGSGIGSPYQPPRNGNENNNSQTPAAFNPRRQCRRRASGKLRQSPLPVRGPQCSDAARRTFCVTGQSLHAGHAGAAAGTQ